MDGLESPTVSSPETQPTVAVIGAGLDLGAGRRGVDMGPSAIRYAELEDRIRSLGRRVIDHGDVRSPVAEAIDVGDPSHRYLGPILQVCTRVADLVDEAVGHGHVPLVLGGDHAIAMGSLGGMARRRGPGAVLWIDAHGDLNRPTTSPTGNVHGMPLAAALGAAGAGFETDAYPVPSIERAALVGIRSLDPGERELVGQLDVKVFTMSDLDKLGVERVMGEALTFLSGSRFVHVSLDLDAVDPSTAPGVGTPVRGGLSYREAHFLLELVSDSGLLDSLDVVEVNPILDRENETGKLAVELVASALGKKIL
jgi:arginase